MPDWEKDLNEFLNGTAPEQDRNFPSVEWIGFIKLKNERKQRLELMSNLIFVDGQIFGCAGFIYSKKNWLLPIHLFQGEYDVNTGKVSMICMSYMWVPLYFEGYNENKKIYGQWKFMLEFGEVSGGFMFWPRGMADPTRKKIG